jgi:hypothetical protein
LIQKTAKLDFRKNVTYTVIIWYSRADDVVTEEYFEKFFCCTKISFIRAQIHSLQINIFGLERIFTLPEEYIRQ